MRAVVKLMMVSAVFTGLLAMHGVSPAFAASHCDDHHGAHGVVVEHEHTSAADFVMKEPCPNEHGMHACAGMVRKSGDEPTLAAAVVLTHVLLASDETQVTVSADVNNDTRALRKPNLHFLSISRT